MSEKARKYLAKDKSIKDTNFLEFRFNLTDFKFVRKLKKLTYFNPLDPY